MCLRINLRDTQFLKSVESSLHIQRGMAVDICSRCHLQACAPSQLPLQTRLDMNMARLHELDSERLGAYGWVGGLVVMVELRHRVLLLRETLNLPPCDPVADLDKVSYSLS